MRFRRAFVLPKAHSEPMHDPGVGGRCRWCKGFIKYTTQPYGARHEAPVCSGFSASMATLEAEQDSVGVHAGDADRAKPLDDLSGWAFP